MGAHFPARAPRAADVATLTLALSVDTGEWEGSVAERRVVVNHGQCDVPGVETPHGCTALSQSKTRGSIDRRRTAAGTPLSVLCAAAVCSDRGAEKTSGVWGVQPPPKKKNFSGCRRAACFAWYSLCHFTLYDIHFVVKCISAKPADALMTASENMPCR